MAGQLALWRLPQAEPSGGGSAEAEMQITAFGVGFDQPSGRRRRR